MNFKIIENDKEINCTCIQTFSNNDINYIIYKEENNDNIYASRYIFKDNSITLTPIEQDSEWDLIDERLESSDK